MLAPSSVLDERNKIIFNWRVHFWLRPNRCNCAFRRDVRPSHTANCVYFGFFLFFAYLNVKERRSTDFINIMLINWFAFTSCSRPDFFLEGKNFFSQREKMHTRRRTMTVRNGLRCCCRGRLFGILLYLWIRKHIARRACSSRSTN